MPVTDLKHSDLKGHAFDHYYGLEQSVDVYRQTHLCAGNGLPTSTHTSQVYSAENESPINYI